MWYFSWLRIFKVKNYNFSILKFWKIIVFFYLKGNAYIETKNLDGETNLESKQADSRIKEKHIRGETMLGKECVVVHYESPNKMIYRFDGRMETRSGEIIPLTYSNVVLRGCCLKNTEYAIGMAVYTGH